MTLYIPDHLTEALEAAAKDNGSNPDDTAVAMLEELLASMGYLTHTCKEGDHERQEEEKNGTRH